MTENATRGSVLPQRSLLAYLGAWSISILAMVGSLYFSEIMKLPPCVLCWYQRIATYPFVLLLPIAIARNDRSFPAYALALLLPGLGISIYHNLLYYSIIPQALAPCQAGISCTTKYVEFLGFLSIPLLALLGLSAMTGLMIFAIRANRSVKSESSS